jgi:hypothetical protein
MGLTVGLPETRIHPVYEFFDGQTYLLEEGLTVRVLAL